MAVGDASIIDPDDVHRVEDRSALECRTARHHQEPAFVLAESSVPSAILRWIDRAVLRS